MKPWPWHYNDIKCWKQHRALVGHPRLSQISGSIPEMVLGRSKAGVLPCSPALPAEDLQCRALCWTHGDNSANQFKPHLAFFLSYNNLSIHGKPTGYAISNICITKNWPFLVIVAILEKILGVCGEIQCDSWRYLAMQARPGMSWNVQNIIGHFGYSWSSKILGIFLNNSNLHFCSSPQVTNQLSCQKFSHHHQYHIRMRKMIPGLLQQKMGPHTATFPTTRTVPQFSGYRYQSPDDLFHSSPRI